MRRRIQNHSLRIFDTLHLVTADGSQVRCELVGILSARRIATQDIFHYLHDIAVLIAVASLRRTGHIGCVAVQQPVVGAGAVEVDRCNAIQVEGTLDTQTDIIGRVGAQVERLGCGLLLTVELQHHLVAYFQVTGHTAQTAEHVLIGARHMYGKGIDSVHVGAMYHVLDRTYVALEDLVDIALFEDLVGGSLLILLE